MRNWCKQLENNDRIHDRFIQCRVQAQKFQFPSTNRTMAVSNHSHRPWHVFSARVQTQNPKIQIQLKTLQRCHLVSPRQIYRFYVLFSQIVQISNSKQVCAGQQSRELEHNFFYSFKFDATFLPSTGAIRNFENAAIFTRFVMVPRPFVAARPTRSRSCAYSAMLGVARKTAERKKGKRIRARSLQRLPKF